MGNKVNQKYNEAREIFKKELEIAIKDTVNKNPQKSIQIKNNAAEEELTEKTLTQDFENCANEPFTIAVCGQVKAGKSTLLNSLIFGDEVLPSFITPETAKLAFICYTDEPNSYFKVNWYNDNEWQDVRATSNSESLNERVTYSNKHQVSPRNCIGKDPRRIDDLSQLDQYTSVPKEDEEEETLAGIYTPFVKSVEIFINNKNLEDLRIVDTPGLNDPNRINSNETTKNLSKAHAIIYVCPVRLFSKPDLEFFEQFMKGRTEDTRIIVQNRIDEEREAYPSVISECRKNPDCLNMGLFGKNEIVCSYSAKVNLAKAKNEKGVASKRDLQYATRYKDFNADPDNLAQKISERLFNNSGKARLEGLAAICIKPYNAQKALLDDEIKNLEFEKKKYNDPIEKVEKEFKKLRDNKKDINKNITNALDIFDNELKTIVKSLQKIIDNDNNCKALREFVETKYAEGKYDRVAACIGHEWIQKTKELYRILEETSYSKIKNLQTEIGDNVDRIINDIKAAVGKEVEDIIINYTKMEWVPPKPKKIELSETHWYTFKSTELSQIIKDVNEAWDNFIDELEKYVDTVRIRLKNVEQNTFNEIAKKLRFIEEVLEERVKSKNSYNNAIKEIEKSIENKKAEIQKHDNKIKELEQLAKKYKGSV